ncbi:MAG: Zn-ribbon domain-containing OB-fold protein [Pseudomonadales bacterium]
MTERSQSDSTPPSARTVLGRQLSDAAGQEHALVLQTCKQCQTVQYPPREVCRECLGDNLAWEPVDVHGTVMASVELQHSLNDFFLEKLPWLIGSIKLDCGPVVMVHMANTLDKNGLKVNVFAHADASGAAVLVAVSEATEIATAPQRIKQMQALDLI